jgi:Bacterial Ig-like domain
MNFQIIRTLVIIFLALNLFSCASVRSPTGGDKDEMPPILITSVPLNYSTSFNQRKITLFFNEEIQINNIQKELTITPKTTIPYTATPKGKKLTIEFERNLEPNTTYTLNFRKAIGDLNENNPPGF